LGESATIIGNSAQTLRPQRGEAMRILLVTEAAAKGTGRHVLDLAQGLIARGREVHLLYSPVRMDESFRKRMWAMRDLIHVALHMEREICPGDLSMVWSARRYLQRAGPFDIIHGHSSKGGAIARLAAIGSGVPAIYTPHAMVTMAPDLSPLKRWTFGFAEWGLSKFSRRIIAVAPEEARFAVASGLGKSRVAMVPNGMGTLEMPPREEARQNCGLRADHVVVGWVGRLVDNKAPDLLLRAAAVGMQTVPQLRLVFIGDGPKRKELETLSQVLGIEEKVVLLGEKDARKFLSAFDILAMTSRMEGMPYVLLEAMAAGLPIVATNASGVELLIKPQVNGAIIPTDDLEALTTELTALATDRSLRLRMGAASQKRVAGFTIDRMVDRILSIYESCIGNPAAEWNDEPMLAGEWRD
jgi:glycosyltransferase involved in cell wall biosynthesis